MNDADLERAAVEAIRSAAERLGVDPFRLARFLAHGRIADYLQTLGRTGGIEIEQRTSLDLSGTYLSFLESETKRGSSNSGGQANGG